MIHWTDRSRERGERTAVVVWEWGYFFEAPCVFNLALADGPPALLDLVGLKSRSLDHLFVELCVGAIAFNLFPAFQPLTYFQETKNE